MPVQENNEESRDVRQDQANDIPLKQRRVNKGKLNKGKRNTLQLVENVTKREKLAKIVTVQENVMKK